MRWSLALAVALGACGFQITPSSVEVDAPGIVDDGGGIAETWSFDTAAELAMPGHERVAMVVEPRGSLTPEGYVYGGLLGRGETNTRLWTTGDLAWGKLATVTPTGAGLWSGQELATTQDLGQFGIRRNAAMRTLWFEGEVLLRPGTEMLRIKGDDIAFLEIAMPGTSAFTPLLESALTPIAPIVVPARAWYPVRIGWADGDTSGDFALEIEGAQGFEAISPHRLRAAVGGVEGTLRTVFYRQMHGGGVFGTQPPVQQLQATAFLAPTVFAPALQGSVSDTAGALSDVDDWSARWAGQLYVTVPGQHTVRVTSDDGNRVVVGTAPVAQATWSRDGSNGNSITTVTTALREGWNDLIVDYNQNAGATALTVEVVSAPDPALIGFIPLARLRPVEPRGERLLVRSVALPTPLAVADDTGVFSNVAVPVAANSGQIVTRVDMTVVCDSEDPDELLFRVVRPGGTPFTIVSHPDMIGGMDLVTHAFSLDAALVGVPADGVWSIGVADDVNGLGSNTTRIKEVHLTLHTSGGPEEIERVATWRTPIKDLGTLVKVDAITWDDRAPAGTAVEVRLRSCEQPDCSDEPSWGDAVAKGMPVALAQRRYLQAQVTMTSDGTSEPELRSLRIMLRRAASS